MQISKVRAEGGGRMPSMGHRIVLGSLRGAMRGIMSAWYERYDKWDEGKKIKYLSANELRVLLLRVWCDDYIGTYRNFLGWVSEYEATHPDIVIGGVITNHTGVCTEEGYYSCATTDTGCHVFLRRVEE